MSTPTRQEIIDAYTAVTTLARLAEEFTPVRVEEHKEINDLHLAVRAALPPKPRPTMADVEWDDDKHYLAEAEHPVWGEVIMLYHDEKSGDIQYFLKGDEDSEALYSHADRLIPTGKRYTLTEIQE